MSADKFINHLELQLSSDLGSPLISAIVGLNEPASEEKTFNVMYNQ